ncbi:type II secretion system protein N [Paraherbaspirillum soli]|uniref:Type II secretion system protein N n=1 Tax=Paraherbaspirillum soli TaxID=631222 RepID=A0ABW0M2J1_9BURK
MISKKLGKHTKRLPGLASLILFMLLCACSAYWFLQLVKPPVRAVAPPPQEEAPQLDLSAAGGLFGGRGAAAVASNYQLLGVVAAKDAADSVAILSADGKPAQSVRAGAEVQPGTSIKEVHKTYVLLSEGGILKRVVLPEDARPKSGASSPVAPPGQFPGPQARPPANPPDPGALPPPGGGAQDQ